MHQIIEDQPRQLDAPLPGLAPGPDGKQPTASGLVVPLLIKLMPSASADVRTKAVACLNLLAREMPVALLDQLDT